MEMTMEQVALRSRPAAAPQDGGEPGSAQAALDRIGTAERRLRITLAHSVNTPMEFDLSAEEAEQLRGQTLGQTIESLLGRIDPLVATTIRQTLRDPAVVVEVQQSGERRPALATERIDPLIEEEEVSLGVSRAMRGG
jgi:hypothetical protein